MSAATSSPGPTESVSLPYHPNKAVDAASTVILPESLCTRCRDIDIKSALGNYRKAAKSIDSYVVADLGSLDGLKKSDCPLCQFFASMTLVDQEDKTCDCILDSQLHTFPDINTRKLQLRAVTAGQAYLGQEVGKRARQDISGFQDQVVLGVGPKIAHSDMNMGTCHHCWYRIGMIAQLLPDSSTTSAQPKSEKGTKKPTKPLSLQARRIISNQIPYDILKAWLNRCRNHHGELCQEVPFTEPPCVKVIDCDTFEIIKTPPGCPYIALSYVWGSTQERGPGPVKKEGDPTVLVMPDVMALVVTDSMEVTRQLGYKYLWIDKYCINQEDKKEKAAQIASMDLIYECSVAVIVAAGGRDSAFGLPGVTTRPRVPQSNITLQDITLCSTLPNPVYAIRRSGWITRGWTFQEAIFSKRRIYFTEHQVVFECDDSIYTEIFNQPWGIEVGQWQHEGNVFTTASLPEDSSALQALVISGKIEEYSGRNLTLDSDALNAFLSFFTRMERLKEPLHQFFGLPIFNRTAMGEGDGDKSNKNDDEADSDDDDDDGDDYEDGDDDDGEDDQEEESDDGEDDPKAGAAAANDQTKIAREVAYTNPVNFLVEGLGWYHESVLPDEMAAIRRRDVFPSWTWLGWTGKLSYTRIAGVPYEDLDEIQIEVEDKQGRLLPWATWDEVKEIVALGKDDQLTGRLRVKGWLEQVRITYLGETVSHEFYVLRQGGGKGARLYISGGEKYEYDDENGVIGYGTGSEMNELYAKLIDNQESDWELLSLGPMMVMLKDEGNGQYSRLGMTGLPEGTSNRYQPRKKDRKSKSESQGKTSQPHRKWVEIWLI